MNLLSPLYKKIVKPVLFLFDAELVHDLHMVLGSFFGKHYLGRLLISRLFCYKSPKLHKNVLGIEFSNPIGLAAGFDYDGHLASIMRPVGFGFNTVGTVTALFYEGNTKPRLARLPKSKSLLINKGFKSGGADFVKASLDKKYKNGEFLPDSVVGLSVGSTNILQIDTVDKAINDYLTTFRLFKDASYLKYFELNISCPNTLIHAPFVKPANFELLVEAVSELNLHKPVFVKMPSEIIFEDAVKLIDLGLAHGFKGYIFSNLVKNRSNTQLDAGELQNIVDLGLKGNFSGRPTHQNSCGLIKAARKKYGDSVVIIGCGGVFNATDALDFLNNGADLVQLITGLVYEGPMVVGEINKALALKAK